MFQHIVQMQIRNQNKKKTSTGPNYLGFFFFEKCAVFQLLESRQQKCLLTLQLLFFFKVTLGYTAASWEPVTTFNV